MTAVQTTVTLQNLIVQQKSECATGLLDGREVVTLGTVERGEIEVCLDGVVQVLRQETLVVPVDESERQVMLMRAALLLVNQRRRNAEIEFAQAFDRMREYAIGKHQEGQFCREGLNEFLRTFGFPEYHPDDDED